MVRLVCLVVFLFATVASGAERIRVVLVGDSTVNDGGGWGPGFRASFGPPVECVNWAQNGRSSKSFRAEGWWTKALAEKPDYVLMQFGHNDVAGKGPDRETDPATTYRENMIRYVEETIAAGATPVLVTSIVRRNFNPDGKFHPDSLALYAEEIRKIAAEKHVLLIDLYAQTLAQTNALGKAGSDKLGRILADGRIDTTHLGPLGQQAIGVMAARSLAKIDSRIRPFFHEIVPGGD